MRTITGIGSALVFRDSALKDTSLWRFGHLVGDFEMDFMELGFRAATHMTEECEGMGAMWWLGENPLPLKSLGTM